MKDNCLKLPFHFVSGDLLQVFTLPSEEGDDNLQLMPTSLLRAEKKTFLTMRVKHFSQTKPTIAFMTFEEVEHEMVKVESKSFDFNER